MAERVYSHASKGQLTVTLGGDHSLVRTHCCRASAFSTSATDHDNLQAMGTVSGTFKAYPDAALIWVDAHAVSLPVAVASMVMHAHAHSTRRTSTRP